MIIFGMSVIPEYWRPILCSRQLSPSKDLKLLHQLDFEDNHVLSVRVFSSSGGTSTATAQLKEVSEAGRLVLPSDETLTPSERNDIWGKVLIPM